MGADLGSRLRGGSASCSQTLARAFPRPPPTVDTEQHGDLLSKYGIDIGDLAGKLPGGIGDKLGL